MTDDRNGTPKAAAQGAAAVSTLTLATPAVKQGFSLRSVLTSNFLSTNATLFGFLLLFFAVYLPWLGGDFFNAEPRMFDLFQTVPVILISVGLIPCLVSNQFDLSAAANASLAVMLTIGLSLKQGLPMPLVIVIVLLIGALVGAVNAFVVLRARITAFIATLAVAGVLDGVALIYSGGSSITPRAGGPQLPEWFPQVLGSFQVKAPFVLTCIVLAVLALSAAFALHEQAATLGHRGRLVRILGFPLIVVLLALVFALGLPQLVNWQILIMLVLAWIVWIAMRYTVVGRSMYAVGGNPAAALLAGLKVRSTSSIGFLVSGVMSSAAGIFVAANQSTGTPQVANGYLLPAYAAVFLSTVLFSRGRFNVWGSVAGCVFLVYVGLGLAIGGFPYAWSNVINGAVLLLAVGISGAFLLRSSK